MVVISVSTSLLCLLIHYEALRVMTSLVPRLALKSRQKVLFVVSAALFTHFIEIGLFAVAFWLFFELDVPAQTAAMPFDLALYISIEQFTSLGTSSGFPIGQVRLLAGSEALVGLIVIGWTASFTYLMMSRLWGED